MIEREDHQVYVSVMSLWEVLLKAGLGKLELPEGLEAATIDSDIKFLPFVPRHAWMISKLPPHHRDPFDRALVAQAASEGMALLTADEKIAAYSAMTDVVMVSS